MSAVVVAAGPPTPDGRALRGSSEDHVDLLLGDGDRPADSSAPFGFDSDGAAGSNGGGGWGSPQRLSSVQLVLLNAYMLGWSGLWTCLYVVTLPQQVLSIVQEQNAVAPAPAAAVVANWTGASPAPAPWIEGQCSSDADQGKGAALALVLLAGGPAQILLPPLVGYISDNTYTRWGSRRPFILAGVLLSSVFVLLLPVCQNLGALALVWFLLQFSSNLGSNTFMALLADVVPADQFGAGSGVMGAFSCFGQFLGAAIGLSASVPAVGLAGCHTLLVTLHVLTALPTLYYVMDAKARPRPPGLPPTTAYAQTTLACAPPGAGTLCNAVNGVLSPFRESRDFLWVFVTRLLFNMGQYTVQEFLQYYVCDLIDTGGTSPSQAVSLMLMPMLAAAAVTAYLGGILSDRLGGRRKVFVYVSGAIMACACVASIFNRNFGLVFVTTTFFGAAFGLFGSVDFALVCDVLPNQDDKAKDMAIWHVALVVPQFIATPISGGLLDSLAQSHGVGVGYGVVFSIACLYFLVGAGLISKVRKAK